MVQVLQRAETVVHDLMRTMSLQMDDEPHAATVVLVLRAV